MIANAGIDTVIGPRDCATTCYQMWATGIVPINQIQNMEDVLIVLSNLVRIKIQEW